MPNDCLYQSKPMPTRVPAIAGALLIASALALSVAWAPSLATEYAFLFTGRMASIGTVLYDRFYPFLMRCTGVAALSTLGWTMLAAAVSPALGTVPGHFRITMRVIGIAVLACLVAIAVTGATGGAWAYTALYYVASSPIQHAFNLAPAIPATAGVCLGLSLGRAK